MFEETRPIDWWMLAIELAVLVLIAYEVGVNVYRACKTRGRTKAIFGRISLGQGLLQNAPGGTNVDEQTAATWVESVKTWIDETHALLAGYSPQAAASFVSDRVGPSLLYGAVTEKAQARDWYSKLICLMNNLREVMEKPEIYF